MREVINTDYFGRSSVWGIAFLFISLAQPCSTKAQARFKTPADSLVMTSNKLRQWHLYGGLHLSSDAELYYLDPSFQAGVDYTITRQLALSAYVHYFHASADLRDDVTQATEKGRYTAFTTAVLLQLNTGAGWYKGFFVAGGLSVQIYRDRFLSLVGDYDDKGTRVIPAIRLGYLFPAGLHAIAVEFNGTGPSSYSDGYGGTITEVFTLVSLGARFIFNADERFTSSEYKCGFP